MNLEPIFDNLANQADFWFIAPWVLAAGHVLTDEIQLIESLPVS